MQSHFLKKECSFLGLVNPMVIQLPRLTQNGRPLPVLDICQSRFQNQITATSKEKCLSDTAVNKKRKENQFEVQTSGLSSTNG